MSTPGPPIIFECSKCMKFVTKWTMNSWNNFGANYWTDGKMEAPMFFFDPALIKCPHCGNLLWISGLKILNREWDRNCKEHKLPSFDEFAACLDAGIDSKEKEIYVRVQLWWMGNDARMDSSKPLQQFEFQLDFGEPLPTLRTNTIEIPYSSAEEENLIALSKLLDPSDVETLLMRAEIERELGHFENGLALLTSATGLAAETIRGLCQRGDRFVRKLQI